MNSNINRAVYSLDWIEGWICVKHVESNFVKPEITTLWWRSYQCHRSEAENLIGRPLYSARFGDFSYRLDNGTGTCCPVRIDGSRAIKVETVDFPCPKVRKGIETEYRNGRWVKYLQSKGWTEA